MKIEHYDGKTEREILTAMIVDKTVLAAISSRWDGRVFPSRHANLMGGWAVDYFRRCHKAPGRAIQSYADRYEEGGADSDTSKMVNRQLVYLSEQYERNGNGPAPEYVLDIFSKYVNTNKMRMLAEEIQGCISVGEVDKAEAKIRDFRKVEVGLGSGVLALTEEAVVVQAFEDQSGQPVVEYDGALGKWFNHALGRDSFIAFMGKEKVGKSFWLLDLAWRAVEQGRKVALFEVGDMSQNQVIRRIGARAACHPIRGDPKNKVKLPTEMEIDGVSPRVTYKYKLFPNDLTGEVAWKALDGMGHKVGGDSLKLSVHPNNTVNVHDIESIIEGWVRQDWVPDVLVIDYADILAPLNTKDDVRDQINSTWKALRSLSQKFHCLLVTATQTDADSYHQRILTRDNFSEDKRKYSHVTGMAGINQTPDEKVEELYRLNWVVLRELEFSEKKCVWTAACLPLANPCVVSSF